MPPSTPSATVPPSELAAAPPKKLPWPSRLRDFLTDRYFTIDRRLLGIFRIYFGFLLFMDVVRRLPNVVFFFSNDGSLSNHFALFAPLVRPNFSIFYAFSTPNEVRVAFLLSALVYFFYMIGFKTRWMQILAIVIQPSLNIRNIFVENGGDIMMAILAVWAAFLPLGDRFSVDAVLQSLRRRDERKASALNDREGIRPPPSRYTSIVVLTLALQIAVV